MGINILYRCREVEQEQKQIMASNVLLAALIIPSLKEVVAVSKLEDEDIDGVVEKNQKMAMLLDFQSNPTRANLLADIVNRGILNDVSPELRTLYDCMESNFLPLKLPALLSPIIDTIKEVCNHIKKKYIVNNI